MTVKEVEARLAQLEAELTTSLEAAKVLTQGSPEFDDAYSRYLASKAAIAKIPEEISKAKFAENAEDIKAAGVTIAEAIVQLIDGLKVAELIGTSVISLRYFNVPSKDAQGNETKSLGAVFNPVAVKAASKKTGGTGKSAGHTMIVDAEGNKLSCTKFVLAHATEAEKASEEFKYPHTRVDSKPKFDEFITAHNLTGFTYELPSQAEETPAS